MVPEVWTHMNAPKPVTDPAILAQLNERPDGAVDDWVTPSKPPFDPSRPFEAVYRTAQKGPWELLTLVTGPPISALIVWFVLVWVIRGFWPKNHIDGRNVPQQSKPFALIPDDSTKTG